MQHVNGPRGPQNTLSVRQCLAPLWPIVTPPNTYCTKRVRDSSTILFWIATRIALLNDIESVIKYVYIYILYIYNMRVCDYRGDVHKNHCKIHLWIQKSQALQQERDIQGAHRHVYLQCWYRNKNASCIYSIYCIYIYLYLGGIPPQ